MERLFSEEYVWVEVDGTRCTIGATAEAVRALGRVKQVKLPDCGSKFEPGGLAATIHGFVSFEVLAPVSGRVIEINTRLETFPEIAGSFPESDGWICRLEMSSLDAKRRTELERLLRRYQYLDLLRRNAQQDPKK